MTHSSESTRCRKFALFILLIIAGSTGIFGCIPPRIAETINYPDNNTPIESVFVISPFEQLLDVVPEHFEPYLAGLDRSIRKNLKDGTFAKKVVEERDAVGNYAGGERTYLVRPKVTNLIVEEIGRARIVLSALWIFAVPPALIPLTDNCGWIVKTSIETTIYDITGLARDPETSSFNTSSIAPLGRTEKEYKVQAEIGCWSTENNEKITKLLGMTAQETIKRLLVDLKKTDFIKDATK